MIPELIKNLAFMITHDLSKEETKYIGTTGEEGVKAKTWISLKYFTNAFDSYSHYNSTQKIEYLECARKNCIKVLKEEKDYLIVFSLFYNIGISYHFLRDYYFAEDSFRRCITLMPTNPKGFIGLISPLYALGRKDEALEACEKALEIDSKYTKAWYNKGVVLDDLGRKDEALEAYKKALEIDSKYTKAWYNKACAYSLMNKKNEALADLKHAIELDPNNRELAKRDKDFKKLWEERDFKDIVYSQ